MGGRVTIPSSSPGGKPAVARCRPGDCARLVAVPGTGFTSASDDNTVRPWHARPVAERVARLVAEQGTLPAVMDALATDPALDPLERYAAANVAARSARQ